MANTAWNARRMANQPRPPAVAAQGQKAEAAKDGDPGQAAEAEAPLAESNAAAAGAADQAADAEQQLEAESDVAPEFVTLGSVNAASPYRMGVTITNVGAA